MTSSPDPSPLGSEPTRFERAAERPAPGQLAELWQFLVANRRWWLWPIVAVLIVLGALIALAGTGVAPFIYTLF